MSDDRVFVGIGSNLADPQHQVKQALVEFEQLPATQLIQASSLYETAPWGIEDQPPFINAVAELRTELAPATLLRAMLAQEEDTGRRRGVRWGPRVIDLDILAWGGRMINEPGLTVPHPRLADRDFVLVPWAEIAPAFAVPDLGTVAELREKLDTNRPQPRRLERHSACTEAATSPAN